MGAHKTHNAIPSDVYEVRRGRLIIVAGALLLIILVQTTFIFSMSMRCETSQQKTPAVIKSEEVSTNKISQYHVRYTLRASPPRLIRVTVRCVQRRQSFVIGCNPSFQNNQEPNNLELNLAHRCPEESFYIR